ncbi:MAG: hypothetical protein ACT4PS_17915 [Betaproteobacteria bacterium]
MASFSLSQRFWVVLVSPFAVAALADVGDRNARKAAEQTEAASYFHAKGYANLGIRRKDLPSVGQCRLWFPGRPAEMQPPEGKCARVSRDIPPGAWLIARSTTDPLHVSVHAYDEQSPGAVVAIGIFAFETRDFVRYASP